MGIELALNHSNIVEWRMGIELALNHSSIVEWRMGIELALNHSSIVEWRMGIELALNHSSIVEWRMGIELALNHSNIVEWRMGLELALNHSSIRKQISAQPWQLAHLVQGRSRGGSSQESGAAGERSIGEIQRYLTLDGREAVGRKGRERGIRGGKNTLIVYSII